MRRFLPLIVCLLAGVGAVWAQQPKVAVLDAVVPANLDQSVVIPVTEKLAERLVVSGKYTVLDRSNVEQVLKEREFQVSGLVSDAEITEAGKYLGADFVVVARVSRVAETYFLSAKLITVKTGVIANQTSAQTEGKISDLIRLAEQAGNVLAGAAATAPKPAVAQPAKPTEPPPAAKPAQPTPAAPKPAADNRIGIRGYVGLGGGSQDITDTSGTYSFSGAGFDMYILAGVWDNFCAVANITYFDATGDDGAAVTSFDFGVGYAMVVGPLMPFAALKFGGASMSMPGSFLDYEGSGTEFAFDAGADFRLDSLLIGVRYQGQFGVFTADGWEDRDNAQNSFWVMVGWRL
jgi:hypothetical protein